MRSDDSHQSPVLSFHRNLNSTFKFRYSVHYLSMPIGLHAGESMNKNQDWVISGMSGRFPESENVDIFWEKLIEGKDLISENNTRWDAKAYQIPRRIGSIGSLDKFDASFFGVSGTQANTMEPKTRISLEVVYEAIVDAGVNPKSLDGDRVGVFMATTFAEAADIWLRSNEEPNGYYITGCYPALLADRISYAFNFKGPSCVFDSACSASFSALQYAILALKSGLCDSAIVGGANINLLPLISEAFFNFRAISADGKCKVFDANCDGFVRSEAVAALYICRKDHAKRSYARIAGIKCLNDGYKPEGISVPSAQMQEQLIKEVYAEAKKNPLDVFYVEAHGTGTKAGDPKEIEALDSVFCTGRKEPFFVGSVKTNMGHAEPASGLCAIIKVLLSRRAGTIPPSLHFQTPNPKCQALVGGRIQVVTEPTTFKGNLVGVNCFGIGGTSAHAILEFDDTELQQQLKKHSDHERLPILKAECTSDIHFTTEAIPTFIPASGRTKDAVEYFLAQAVKNSNNAEFVGLIQNIARTYVPRHDFGGYALITSTGDFEIVSQKRPESCKSTWYIYTGLGSQWHGMIQHMIKFKTFENSINLSSIILKNKGINLKYILQTEDPDCLNNLQNAFVAIVSCQIALTDLLKSLEIFPDGMLGHSLGEVTCGYADGCLTHEQTILTSLYRARAFLGSNLPVGTMASVDLSWEEAQKRCPSDIFRAIHNSENNTTVGGPKESISEFVNILSSEGIFAKEVKSVNHAYHTKYVRGSEQLMLTLLEEVIPGKMQRSNKWLSTSVPVNDWDSVLSTFCSAEYLVNNALSPVCLYEVLQLIPHNSVVIEIGPHCFLQAVLKKSLQDTSTVIGLMHCKRNNTLYFLQSVGKLFFNGCSPNINALYDPLKFPVSIRVPSISSLIKWDHNISWEVPQYSNEISAKTGTKYSINLTTEEFYTGHVVQEQILFPATGYIWLVWKAFARLQFLNPEELPIQLENLNFTRVTELHPKCSSNFIVSIFIESGNFEIVESKEIVCTGTIQMINNVNDDKITTGSFANSDDETLDHEDFYKLLRLKGYNYQGLFRGVQSIEREGTWAKLEWKDNWICFLDTILQTQILEFNISLKDLVVPIRLESCTIDPIRFKKSLNENTNTVTLKQCKHSKVVRCPGIQLSGFKVSSILFYNSSAAPTITVQKFLPYIDPSPVTRSKQEVLEFFIGIVVENSHGITNKPFILTEILKESVPIDPLPSLLYLKFPSFEHRVIQPKFDKYCGRKLTLTNLEVFDSITDVKSLTRGHLVKIENEEDMSGCMDLLQDNGFIALCTPHENITSNLIVVAKKRTENEYIYLLRKGYSSPFSTTIVSIDMPDYDWIEVLKESLESAKDGHRVHILSMDAISGIIGFTKCLFQEPGCENVRCIHIPHSISLNPGKHFPISNDVLKKDLIFNVFKSDCWGSYGNMVANDFGKLRISKHVYGNVQAVGDLSSLCWIESLCKLHQREFYEVHYSSLNFRDIMIATGKLPRSAFPVEIQREECILGVEFSGTYRKKRVCGISLGKCLASYIDHTPCMVWDVPDQLSLAEAATIPVVYATVLYSLLMRGQLKKRESILIHSGSGAVGLAAITIALDLNCTVFTTVGSNKKREFLLDKFPQLQKERIMDSKNEKYFKVEILKQTEGKGVNVVLNSLAQEKLKASLLCLGRGGQFLEIGKFDSFADTAVGLAILLKSVTIHGIQLNDVLVTDSDEKFQLQEMMQRYLDQGKLKPLPFTCFNSEQLENAFRYLSSGKHIGKIIIKVREMSGTSNIAALPRTYFYPHKTYIIVGGLGGMGLEIVTWMLNRGARNLFVVSRSGISTSYQKYMVKSWVDLGANVFLRNTDISNRAEVYNLMMEAKSAGPLGGIFNLALVLHDALFINQSAKAFESVSNCKAAATKHFDFLSRNYVPNLDHFVVFSSVTSSRGNAGQSNYGNANSVMERICEQRKVDGLSALAIQWGPVADVGSFGNIFQGKKVLQSFTGQSISSCIDTFDLLLQQSETVVSSFILPIEVEDVSITRKEASLTETVAGILGIQDSEKIDINASMTELGLDSIMSVQFRHVLHKKKNIVLPAVAYGDLTFKDLIAMH